MFSFLWLVIIGGILSGLGGALIRYLLAQYPKYNKRSIFFIMLLILNSAIFLSLNFVHQTSNLSSNSVANQVGQSNMQPTITVGISADFPPFTYIENEQFVGFDIDLVNELGKRLNKQINWQNMPFGTLLPNLQLGHIQVIAAGLTATPERAKHVLFTKPYIDGSPFVIISAKDKPIQNLAQLGDQEVVVNEGYTADLYLSNISGLNIKRLKSPAEAFLALKSGRAKAFVTAKNTIDHFFAQPESQDFVTIDIDETQDSCSLAISPKYPHLLARLQTALDSMEQDGTLLKLKNKWKLI